MKAILLYVDKTNVTRGTNVSHFERVFLCAYKPQHIEKHLL